MRFTVFDSGNTPAITSNLITAVIEDRDAGLWIGTDGGGLVRYLDGRFTQYTTRDGLSGDHVMALLQDRGGDLWVATDVGGVTRFAPPTRPVFFQISSIGTVTDTAWARVLAHSMKSCCIRFPAQVASALAAFAWNASFTA